jgi:RNA ligase (TIGR02306 family)
MTDWLVRIVMLERFEKHPNADTLFIVDVEGSPVVVKEGSFASGDLAVYVPIDSIMPSTPENLVMFGSSLRVRAKKIRGMFSRGYLMPVTFPDAALGQLVDERLGITKWEPKVEREMASSGFSESPPRHFNFPEYTDIEPLRRHRRLFENHPYAGREVILTEKVHGANSRFCHDGERLWVGSRTQVKAAPRSLYPGHKPKDTWWWIVAVKLDLESKLAKFPLTVFYGEVFGRGVQDLHYGTDITFRVFDTLDGKTGVYNDWDITVELVKEAGLETVPLLYRGPWAGIIPHQNLAEGPSTLGGDHTREGYVVKPTSEMWAPEIGRIILKYVGQGYELRKVGK